MRAREAAYTVLSRVGEEFANLLLKDILPSVDKKDRALTSIIVYGVLSNRTRLDYVLSHFCNFDKPTDEVKNILRIGTFQILFLDRVPDFSAVNESVELSKKYAPFASKFVNGVLRKVSSDEVSLPDKENLVSYLKIKYSFPKSIIKKWISMFGEEEAEKLLASMNEPPKMYVRVNMLKATADEVLKEIGGKLVLPNLIEVDGGLDIGECELYGSGKITVMQKSSCLCCLEAKVKPNDKVLDMCAAPGGKTLYLAELMENKGEITACDLFEHRTKLIEKSAERMGIDIVKCRAMDSTVKCDEFVDSFDFVLLDAPCSGYGVIQQKPDIKWRKREGGLPAIQKSLCDNAVSYLKRGGSMIYSTCTINDEENEEIVAYLEGLGLKCDYMKTYLPHKDGTNGFFVSRLLKG